MLFLHQMTQATQMPRMPTNPDWPAALPPDEEVFGRIVQKVIASLPPPFDAGAATVGVQITDFAPAHILAEMGMDDAFDLTGLYDGIPLTEKSVMDQPHTPDTIWLFRRPILDEWTARGDIALGTLIAHVYLHELAHHYGWSDADIAMIAPWQD